jgi:phage shock protein E
MFQFIKNIFFPTPVNFKELVQNGAVIVDVRSVQEFKSGHVKNAINIPLDQLKSKIVELKKKNKPIITVCRSGARSSMAKQTLKNAGITVYNGGAWNNLQSKI